MTVNDKLDEIQARADIAPGALADAGGPAQRALDTLALYDAPALVNAVRAVLAEVDRAPDRIGGQWVSAAAINHAIEENLR